jgi:sialic acid synthase
MVLDKQPYVVAEIGCNHLGRVEVAQKLILAAAVSGANAVKFQKRSPKELLSPEQYNSPHPNPVNSYGPTYGAHREFLEFPIETHAKLKKFCEDHGITYSTSVWDMTSAKEVVSLSPDFIKIPSACNNHREMLAYLRDHYKGDIHVSLGMTTKPEYDTLFWDLSADEHRVVVYHCTSGYPVPMEKLYLHEIPRLAAMWSRVGFSGHHLGIAVDVAAYTLGAAYVERHFTLDRTWKGTDHAASLEPAGLTKLVRDLKAVHAALQDKPQEMDPIEVEQRMKLKYRGEAA